VAADKTRHMCGTPLTFLGRCEKLFGSEIRTGGVHGILAALLRQDPKIAERDVYLKCVGKVTLALLDHVRLSLVKKE